MKILFCLSTTLSHSANVLQSLSTLGLQAYTVVQKMQFLMPGFSAIFLGRKGRKVERVRTDIPKKEKGSSLFPRQKSWRFSIFDKNLCLSFPAFLDFSPAVFTCDAIQMTFSLSVSLPLPE